MCRIAGEDSGKEIAPKGDIDSAVDSWVQREERCDCHRGKMERYHWKETRAVSRSELSVTGVHPPAFFIS